MLSILFLLSCSSDVSIMKRYEPEEDTSPVVVDSAEPSTEPEDSPEPSTEPLPNEGITGYTYLHLRQVACPACVGETQEIRINFEAEFHQPISDNHTGWVLQQGQCVTNLFGSDPSTIPQSVGSSISINNPSHSFTAPTIGQGYYQTQNIWESQLQRDALYEVVTEAGSYSFISSHGFDYLEPYTMLYVDPSYAFAAPIYRTGASFSWGPTSPNSTFVITVQVFSYDGSQMLGLVSCAGPDNGFMTIPAQYLQMYPSNSLVAIYLSRHKIELAETDINNSYIETHMEWEVVGTGFLQ